MYRHPSQWLGSANLKMTGDVGRKAGRQPSSAAKERKGRTDPAPGAAA
jgi:hypothetical protein